jgi:transcriptional regulator with XRE-family HTH domain
MASTPDTPLTPLGKQLRAGRKRAGLSIRQAAALAGLSHTAWTTLETGRRAQQGNKVPRPRVPTVLSAAHVVNLDPAKALRLAGYDPRHWIPDETSDPPAADSRTVADRIGLLSGSRLDAVAAIVHHMLVPTPHVVDTDGESDVA